MRSLLHYLHLRNMIVQAPLLLCYDMSEETDCRRSEETVCRRLSNGTSDISDLHARVDRCIFVSQVAGMEKAPNELTLKVTNTM
jgi:hypothetical protein